MSNAPSQTPPQPVVVTVSDGKNVVMALQDASGRIITATQMQVIRDGQQVELDKVTALRDQLVSGESAATDLILSQARDELERRIAVLDLQKSDLNQSLQKLKAGDVPLRQEILQKMTGKLSARVDLMTASRDRSDQFMTQMQATDVTALPVTPTPVVKP